MQRLIFKKDLLPHLLAIIIFLLVTIVFFSPVYFQGKSLHQDDIYMWQGGAKELMDFREETGEEGLWTNSMFSGMPGYLINTQFSGDLIYYFQRILAFGLPHPTSILFTSFLCYYIMLLVFGVRPGIAIAGALAFGLSSFNIIGLAAGHNARIAAISFMPLVLAGIHLCLKSRPLLGAVITSIGLAIQLRVNHIQITYYLLLVVLIYGAVFLVEAYKNKGLKSFITRLGFLVLAVLLAVGANLGRLWTILEYNKYSMRGISELSRTVERGENESGLEKSYAFTYSSGISESLTLFIPNYKGGPNYQSLDSDSNLGQALRNNGVAPGQINQYLQNVPTYWGKQPATAPYYLGAIMVFLFVFGLLQKDPYLKIWITSSIILGILLSWGSNFSGFNYFMFDHFPGYNKFRSVSFALVIPIFLAPVLSSIGLNNFLKNPNQELLKKLLYALAITGGFALLVIIFAGAASFRGAVDAQLAEQPSWFLQALREDRESLMRGDAIRSLILILLSGGLIWLIFMKKVSQNAGIAGIILLALIDSFSVSKRYLNEDNFKERAIEQQFTQTEADQRILQDNTPGYRVYNLLGPFNEARTSYFHHSIGGYHGAKIRRYQDLIENCLAEETNDLISDLRSGIRQFEDYPVINMLNAKYLVAGARESSVLVNSSAYGAAWLATEVIKVQSADEELDAVCSIKSKQQAVIDISRFNVGESSFSGLGTVSLDSYAPNYLTYSAKVEGASLLIFSEIYYPEGWSATINGEPLQILRANYVLRAAVVPAGDYVIKFTFAPGSYSKGNKVMLIFSILIICFFFYGLYSEYKESKKVELKKL
jgi:hypothetical protein